MSEKCITNLVKHYSDISVFSWQRAKRGEFEKEILMFSKCRRLTYQVQSDHYFKKKLGKF